MCWPFAVFFTTNKANNIFKSFKNVINNIILDHQTFYYNFENRRHNNAHIIIFFFFFNINTNK